MRALFLLSAGRSGSQMLARSLAEHPGIDAWHEPEPHLLDLNYLAWLGASGGAEREAELGRRRDARIEASARAGRLYVESAHDLSFLVAPLSRRYAPQFVHVVRNGHDFARSALQRGWYKWPKPLRWARLQMGARGWLRPDPSVAFECHRLWPPGSARERWERLGWLWSEYNDGIARQLRAGTRPHMLLRLEEVADDAESALRRVLAFAGVETDAGALDAMVRRAGSRPNRTEKSGQVRRPDLSPEERRAFDRWAGGTMRAFGYGESTAGPWTRGA